MSSEPFRLAIVGTGAFAEVHAAAAARTPEVELVACASRDATKAEAFRASHDLARAGTFDELLADDGVDGIVLTTPNPTHVEMSLRALDAGKAVLVEKPVSTTLEDGARLVAACRASGGVCAVGHNARRLAGVREMRRMIDAGELGTISMVEANFSNPRGLSIPEDAWRLHTPGSEAGVLVQVGIHQIDTVQYLLGPVVRVNARLANRHLPNDICDVATLLLEFASGVSGTLASSWLTPGRFSVDVYGTERRLAYGLPAQHWSDPAADGHSSLDVRTAAGDGNRSVVLAGGDVFSEQLRELASAARGETPVEVGPEVGLRNVAVLQAAVESSRRGGVPVEVAELLARAGA